MPAPFRISIRNTSPQHAKIGIPSCQDRNAATRRADELVYIGDNPYFHVRPLNYSIPYLVPRAATLLEEIGHSFLDSLTNKGYAFQQLVITSVCAPMPTWHS